MQTRRTWFSNCLDDLENKEPYIHTFYFAFKAKFQATISSQSKEKSFSFLPPLLPGEKSCFQDPV